MAKVVEEEAARATSIVKKETTFERATKEKPANNETANHSYAEAMFIVEKETALESISKRSLPTTRPSLQLRVRSSSASWDCTHIQDCTRILGLPHSS